MPTKPKLGLPAGIALSCGSIIGSGILYLPSITFLKAGSSALLAWAATIALCIPLIFIFYRMFDHTNGAAGIGSWLTEAFGQRAVAFVPYILLGTTSLGMPAAALIVGSYFESTFAGFEHIRLLTALGIIAASTLVNLFNISTSAKIQYLVSFSLFVVATALIALSLNGNPLAPPEPLQNIGGFLSASVLAFWAFAGFENMTFMYKEFENPKRDITLSMIFSLLVCGFLYVLLTYVVAINSAPGGTIDFESGLIVLAEAVAYKHTAVFVSLFALFAVFFNYISWIIGISRLIENSAQLKLLPRQLKNPRASISSTPNRSIMFLFVVFSTSTIVLHHNRDWLETALSLVSTNFIVIYILIVSAFVKLEKNRLQKGLAAILLVGLVTPLLSSPTLLLYPCALLTIALLRSYLAVSKGS